MSRDLWALLFSFGTVGLLCGLVWRWWRGPLTRLGVDATPDGPRSFGYKCWWLAVRAGSAEEVVRALGLDAPAPCNWASGFERVFGAIGTREVFVSPPVEGWVFVVNHPVADPSALDAIARLPLQVKGYLQQAGGGATLRGAGAGRPRNQGVRRLRTS